MKTTKLSHAIRLILAAQLGAASVALVPEALAQQALPMPTVTVPQGAHAGVQAQPVYQYPQYPAPQAAYSYGAQPSPQVVYAQPSPQVVYAQPQPPVQQPIAVQVQPQPQMISTPQGLVMYTQPQRVPQFQPVSGAGVMRAPPAQPYAQQGAVRLAPPTAAAYPQPVMMYAYMMPNGQVMYAPAAPVQNGAVAPQFAMPQAAMAAAPTPSSQAAASVLAPAVGADDPVLQERPRRAPGSLSKLDTSPDLRPSVTLGADELRSLNAVNVESALQRLPQAIPDRDRSSNNPGDGRATVDLRGLGTGRTAVLVNGLPFVPSGSETVDLNAIPPALLKQVDVTTGGASVAYGSGAVAGAVNFVMDENFQGSQINVSHQSTGEEAGALSSADLTLGTSLGGRGNLAVNIGMSEREALFQGDREFSTFNQVDDIDASGNPILVDGGSSGVPGTSIFSGALGDFSPDSFGVVFDSDGSIRPFRTGEVNDLYNFAPVNYLQLPQTRKHVTLVGNLELAESLEIYTLGMFSDTQTTVQLAPTPIFQSNTEFTLDGSPFLPEFSQQILSDAFGNGIDTDGDGIDDTATAFIRRRLLESGPRRAEYDSVSAYAQLGLRGALGSNLEYDIYATRGSVDTVETQGGNVSRSRFRQALLLDLEADPTGGVCQQTQSDTTDLTCAPVNIFGEGNISQAGADFIAGGVVFNTESTQSLYGARLTGTLDSLPAGEARVTVGAERRENLLQVTSTLTNITEQGDQAGFNARPDFDGMSSSESIYADLYVPLIANANGAELVDLELGYRLTDYTTAKGVASYGANVSWAPNEMARVRAGYNRAHRAPNLGELFSVQSEGFPGATDPCSAAGSNGPPSPELIALCVATGVPEELVGSPLINPASGQVRAVSGGNPDLIEEQADTFFAGVEFAVPFGDQAQARAGIDYFRIDGSQGISAFGGGASNVLNNCYDTSQSSAGDQSIFCDVINRAPDGTIDSIELTDQNFALFELEGLDVFAGVALPAMGGNFGVDYMATIYNTHRFTAFEGDDALECAGRYGNQCGEPIPNYSHQVSAGWSNDTLGARLIWRHIGEVTDDDDSIQFFVEKIGAQNYLDAELSLNLADSIGLAAGVQNLTNNAPPVLGNNQEQANTFPATYDVYGRTYFVRLTGTTGD